MRLLLLLTCLAFAACGSEPQESTDSGDQEEAVVDETQSNSNLEEELIADEDEYLGLIPERTGYVVDNAKMLTQVQRDTLSMVLEEHQKRAATEMVLLTTKHYGPYTDIESFINDVHNAWNLGQNGMDNGVLILINPDMGELRISTGNAVGKVLTEEQCDRIIRTIMFPYFQSEQMYQGVISGVVEMARVIERVAAGGAPTAQQ